MYHLRIMNVTLATRPSSAPRGGELPGWLIPPFLLGATGALAGGFWDDAWHTERGRDSFFIAPHFAIYAGISLAGGALALWALLILGREGLRAALGQRALVLALASVAVTLASAPVDNIWHVAFGRDAVIWSPPHVLGIVGSAGLVAAILLELVGSPQRWAQQLRWVAAALLLAAFSFLVVEYDTDVPQFPVVWYLPVLALTSSLALSLVRLATGERLAATRAAAAHLAYFGLVALFLALEGFDTPKAPLVIAGAIVLDLSAQRGLPLPVLAGLYVVALYAVYVPSLDLLGHGVRLDAGDVAIGLPIGFLVVLGVLALVHGRRPQLGRLPRLAGVALLALGLLLAFAGPALAHDPGQGTPAGSFSFSATLDGAELAVSAHRNQLDCAELSPAGLVGRRAGEVERGSLTRMGCQLRGAVRLPSEGRWFVYLDARKNGEMVESWIPVKVGEGLSRFAARERFAYIADRKPATALKVAIGTVMYALAVVFLVAIVRLVRAARADPEPAASAQQRARA